MKFLTILLLSIGTACNIYCWEDHPDRDDKRDLLSKEEALERTSPDARFSIDPDKGDDRDSRCEPERGTFGPPDRDN